jgi:hypothetical protein
MASEAKKASGCYAGKRSKKSKPCFVFISGYALACFIALLRRR